MVREKLLFFPHRHFHAPARQMVLPFAAQIMYNRPIVSAEVNGMYQALYRKYRPQTFSDVVGQRSVTETLRAQITGGKLSHAYLFTGTRGTGKTSCAKILAKAVNCENPQDGNPCNHCAACRAIDSGSCMDVQEIDAASNNGVDSVRILRDDAIYTPGEVKMRVYIIDEVHMLSTAAFNALLKIIEEPPAHLLFILATTELHKVPATILSRCQRFSFRRLMQEDIASRINYVAYQEHIEIEPDAVQLLARLADGALRDGLSLLDQCASAATGSVTAELVDSTLGLAGERKAAEIFAAVADKNASRALELFSGLYASGKDVAAMTDELCSLSRDLLMLKSGPEKRAFDADGRLQRSGGAGAAGAVFSGGAAAHHDAFAADGRRLSEERQPARGYGAVPDPDVPAAAVARCEGAQRPDRADRRKAGLRHAGQRGGCAAEGSASGGCGRRRTAPASGRCGRSHTQRGSGSVRAAGAEAGRAAERRCGNLAGADTGAARISQRPRNAAFSHRTGR